LQNFFAGDDDLDFERVYFAIEYRHRGLPAELNELTENLEPLARFLIRRAQLKGPYELMRRDVQPSETWKKYESIRLTQLAAANAGSMCALSPDLLLTERLLTSTTVLNCSVPIVPCQPESTTSIIARPPTDHNIDPRLLYALPGALVGKEFSGSLTMSEMQLHQRRNRDIEAFWESKLRQLPNQQQGHGIQHTSPGLQGSLQGHQNETMLSTWQGHPDSTLNPAFQQQHTPSHIQHLGQQTVIPAQLPPQAPISVAHMYTPAQHLQQHPSQRATSPASMQYLQPNPALMAPTHNVQPPFVPIAPRSLPAQSSSSSTRHRNARSGLPFLTRPAGISKATFDASATAASTAIAAIAAPPDWNDAVQLAERMAAFKKLERGEKVSKLVELDRAAKMKTPNSLKAVQRFRPSQGIAGEDVAAVKLAETSEGMVKQRDRAIGYITTTPDQQAITVPAPVYQTHPSAHTTTPGFGAFVPHPGYSNVTSSFQTPRYGPPMGSALAIKTQK
jgi:hypothetical protein